MITQATARLLERRRALNQPLCPNVADETLAVLEPIGMTTQISGAPGENSSCWTRRLARSSTRLVAENCVGLRNLNAQTQTGVSLRVLTAYFPVPKDGLRLAADMPWKRGARLASCDIGCPRNPGSGSGVARGGR